MEGAKACGHLACQVDSQLRSLRTSVCSAAPVAPAAAGGKKKGKNEKTAGDATGSSSITFTSGHQYRVLLMDSVLFPEGGGQPSDYGWIVDAAAVDTLQTRQHGGGGTNGVGTGESMPLLTGSVGVVYNVQNENGSCALYVWAEEAVTSTWLTEGATVSLYVDWPRRLDHMQQHSGQHLISAIAQSKFGADTGSWELKQWHTGLLLPTAWSATTGSDNKQVASSNTDQATANAAVALTACHSEDEGHLPFSVEGKRVHVMSTAATRAATPMTTGAVADAPPCHVDLSVSHMFGEGRDPSAEDWAIKMQEFLSVISGMVECAIEADHKMHPQVVTLQEANARGVFGRELKVNELPEQLRLILIGGKGELDANLCCGTHVYTLGQLRNAAVLSFEKFKSGKLCKVFFAVGRRLRVITEAMSRREDRLTAVMRVPHLQLADEATRVLQNCTQLSGVKEKYRSLWLKNLIAEKCAEQDKLQLEQRTLNSTTVTGGGDAAQDEVRVVVVLVDDVVSSDEGKQITAEAIIAFKQTLGLYELEKAVAAGRPGSDGQKENAQMMAGARARCFRLIGLVLVVPANVCNTGRGAFSVNPGKDGYWAIVGHESLVENKTSAAVTSALRSKGGGGRGGICQGKWCWPPVGGGEVKISQFVNACDDAGSALQQMFVKGN